MIDYIAHILISPINQCLLGTLFGLVLLKVRPCRKKLGKSIIALSLIWGFLCSQYFFSYWLIAPLEKHFPAITINNEKWHEADAIWILACYHYDAQSLPQVSQFNHCSLERLVHAANMYRKNPLPIYLTGSDFNNETTLQHASQAALFLQQLGVPEYDIIIINKGKNTVSEAKQVLSKLNQPASTLAVVSSATHGRRLAKILDNVEMKFVFIPVHYATKGEIVYGLNTPSIIALERSERAFYEYAALIKHWIKT